MKWVWGILAVAAVWPVSSPAKPKVLFGPEFTFSSPDGTVSTFRRDLVMTRMENHLVFGQPDGEKFEHKDRSDKFTSPNGWWFIVDTDPGVLEVTMKPMSADEIRLYKDDIQDAIFVSAANENLFPWEYMGGGHINIDLASFDDDYLWFRNFIIDYWNHNELAMGALGYDTHNALSFSQMDIHSRREIKAAIAAADAGRFGRGRQAIEGLASAIRAVTDATQDQYWEKAWGRTGFSRRARNHDLNFDHIAESSSPRLEIRAVRPQKDMDVWLNQIELLEGRMEFLKTIRFPIPLSTVVDVVPATERTSEERVRQMALNPPIKAQEALRSFWTYLHESGRDWNDYRDEVWPEWIRSGELRNFENSKWFRRHERHVCEEELVGA